MPEMNRAVAGHGSANNPFSGGTAQPKGRMSFLKNAIADSINQGMGVGNQQANNDHEIRKMVTQHVLAKDMHSHLHGKSDSGTQISMDYQGIKTGNIKRTPKPRAQKVGTTEAPHVPQTPNTAPVVAKTIPTHPGTWEGGTLEHGPKGRAQVRPGYKEFKARKQSFETGIASQQGHFAVKPGVKIPNYSRKAMQPKQSRKPRGA